MEQQSIASIIRALNGAGVRYLVVGGLAVVAHGYVRFTADLDLIVDLEPGNVRRALQALAGLGYSPRAPVAMDGFADPALRREWVERKGMTVFSLHSAAHAATEVDLFAEVPLDFDAAFGRAVRMEVAPSTEASFASLDDLIRLKERAGRPQDMQDVDRLRELRDA